MKIRTQPYLGKRIKDVNANFNNITIDHLVSGVYMVKIYSEKSIAYRKFIKE
ncbi:MAG: T9SS type A sorting domain-containing protein [Flavobacteriales bacterium]|nr:T9SS type A sorting domain-containing protein [Flavobacteriales bacterium]